MKPKKTTQLKPLFKPSEVKGLLQAFMEEKKEEMKLEERKEKLLSGLIKIKMKNKKN